MTALALVLLLASWRDILAQRTRDSIIFFFASPCPSRSKPPHIGSNLDVCGQAQCENP